MKTGVKLWAGVLAGSTALLSEGVVLAQDATRIEFGSGMANGFPESVTSTEDGTLYAGSFTGGMIHRAEPGATAAEVFIEKPAEGPGSVIGVFADEAAGTLWACYADMAAFSGGEAMPSVLRSYDIESGEETGAFEFPAASFCNDIATTEDGTAYAADTSGSRVLRIAPGATEAEVWFEDEAIAGVDGLSFGPDGALYLNSVTTNKLFRLELGEDGAAGELTELTPSEPLQGADGMRFGPDGTLYLAENAAGRVSALTIDGDNVTVTEIQGGFDSPTAVTLVGDTLYVAEAKLGMMGGQEDPGTFYVHAVSLNDAGGEGGAEESSEAPAPEEAGAEQADSMDTSAEDATQDAAEGDDAALSDAAAGEGSTDATDSAMADDGAGNTASAGNAPSIANVVTALGNLGNIDFAGMGESADVQLVRLSELGEGTAEETAALEEAITASQADREAFQDAIEGNEVIGAVLGELGIPSEDVLALGTGEDGNFVVYVDDRN